MRFMGPEEGGIVAVSRTPELGLVGIFAAGASPSNVASPSEEGGKQIVVAKVGTVTHKEVGSPTNMGFSGFLHFFPAFGICCHPGCHDPTCSGQLRTSSCQQSI
jgi:hypothetical protein